MWIPNKAEKDDDLTIIRNQKDSELRQHNLKLKALRIKNNEKH